VNHIHAAEPVEAIVTRYALEYRTAALHPVFGS
jgi:hypothetical protein